MPISLMSAGQVAGFLAESGQRFADQFQAYNAGGPVQRYDGLAYGTRRRSYPSGLLSDRAGLAFGRPRPEVYADREASALQPAGAYFESAYRLHEKHRKSFPNAQPNLADLARLMLEQGARPEELLAARKEAFDSPAGTLLIAGGKTRASRRTLNLTEASRAILERRLQMPGPWLFPSDRNPGCHLTKLACTHDRVCLEAGVSFVLYDFRHTFATRQIDAGTPVPVVAAIMGHNGLRTIWRYVHPTSAAQKQAMENYEAAQKRRKLKLVNGK
jgi:integrase